MLLLSDSLTDRLW